MCVVCVCCVCVCVCVFRVKTRTSIKNSFNPLESNIKHFELTDVAAALDEVIADSILFTAVPKPDIDIVREVITCKPVQYDVASIYDITMMSDTILSFKRNEYMNKENVEIIESLTRGQSNYGCWYSFRRCVVTASEAHDVKTRMESLKRGWNH